MDYFVRCRVTTGHNTFYVVFEEPKSVVILSKEYPDFFVIIDLRNIHNVVSLKSIDSEDDLAFWLELDIPMMLEECSNGLPNGI